MFQATTLDIDSIAKSEPTEVDYTKDFFNKTNVPYAFQIIYPIPKAVRSNRGYKFSIQK